MTKAREIATADFGGKNRIINGCMRVDQRNEGAALTLPAATEKWTADRWAMQSAGGGTAQQITSTLDMGFTQSLKYTASASGSFLQMGQQIEYLNFGDLAGKTVAISFYIKANNSNSGSTALIVRTRTSTSQDAGIRFSGTNSDTAVTISTTATRYTVTRAIPSTAKSLSLEFALGSHVSGDGFEITGVQLEEGDTATSFDRRSLGAEEYLCKRYYQTNPPSLTWGQNAGGILYMHIAQAQMRAQPSVMLRNTTFYWESACWASVGSFTNGSAHNGHSTPRGGEILINGTVSPGQAYGQLSSIGDAILHISAEL